MRDLERTFHAGPGNWEPVRDADVDDIERAIAIVTFPEQKAPQLKATLQGITARSGSLTLDFLAKYRTDKIRAWLEQFPGVGPKTSGAVVNFSALRRRALCIDSHHLRVAQRLNLVPRADAATTEERLMRLVSETWDAAMLDEHHSLVKLHAQTLCTFSQPKCDRCPLLTICHTGKRNLGELHLTGTPQPLH
jgi:endonuclease-3